MNELPLEGFQQAIRATHDAEAQLAGRYRVSETHEGETVRYYERTGLVRRPPRSASNYRLYREEDVYRVRFIKAAQATGFTLDDVAELLKPSSCSKVQGRIAERLEEVSARMKDLRHVQRVLKRALTTCQEHEPTGRCGVIDTLSASARTKQP